MDLSSTIEALLDLARDIGITVRFVPMGGDFPGPLDHRGGSLVRLRDSEILFIDPTASPTDQIDAARIALSGREELENRFLSPILRELLEGDGGFE